MKPHDIQTEYPNTTDAGVRAENPLLQRTCGNFRLPFWQRQRLARVIILFIISYIFCACFAESFFLGDYKILPLRQAYMVLLASLFLYFCVKARYLGGVLYFVVCTLSVFLIYAQHTYGCVLSEALVRAVLETNLKETAGFVNRDSISSFLLGVLISVALYLGARWIVKLHENKDSSPREGSSWKRNSCKGLFALTAFCALYALPGLAFSCHLVSLKQCSPMTFLMQLRQPFSWVPDTAHEVAYYYRDIVLDDSTQYPSASKDPQTPMTCVLVIGESVRADHVPAGGYERNTMPRLSSEAGITFFSRMYSYGPGTSISLEGILSGLTKPEEHATRSSFLGILKKEGYVNRAVFENTDDMFKMKLFHTLTADAIEEHKIVKGSVKEVAASILRDIKSNSSKRQLVFVENGTGHYPYKYDDCFDKFQPSDMSNAAKGEARTNRYDNSILAIDSFLADLIEGLKGMNAVVLYCSDHGESLGENNHWGHAIDMEGGEEIHHVAAFIWFSETYRGKHPEVVAAMEAAKDKVLVQGQIYATILTLCGVTSEVPLNIEDFAKGDILKQQNNIGHLVR